MIHLTRAEFSLLLEELNSRSAGKSDNRKSLYVAIADQILRYAKLNSQRFTESSGATTQAQRIHAFFELVSQDLGLVARSQNTITIDDTDPTGRSLELYKRMRRGISEWEFTIAVYYWFHRDDARAAFAEKIDHAVFGQPLYEKFNLTRDKYTPLTLDERDFAIGSFRFSTDDSAATLHIQSEPLGAILDGGYPSPSRAMSWQYGLTDLIGRNDQKRELLDWARSAPGEVRLRLLSGAGGSGKSRLASELARELSEQKSKWNAGFLGNETDEIITVHTPAEGVLLIIDYPEERMAFVERVIDGLRDRSDAHVSVRVLLLSRLDRSHWEHASFALGHRFSVQNATATQPLLINDAVELVGAAFQALCVQTNTTPSEPVGAEAWLQAAPIHRLPLFATAAALHAFLVPTDAFGLNGAEVVEALALIERGRARSYSKAVGLGEYGLERLIALASISPKGLGQFEIEQLAQAGLPLDQSGQALIDALGKTPWWSARSRADYGVMNRLLPDRLAVAFIAMTLLSSKTADLPKWMSITLEEAGPNIGAVLSRLLFDLSLHDEKYRDVLNASANQMLDLTDGTLERFRAAALREQTFLSAPLFIAVIQRLLKQTDDSSDQATLLHNLATIHHRIDETDLALVAYLECLRIRRKFTRWPWASAEKRLDLALTLKKCANCLRNVGRVSEAEAMIDESLSIRTKLIQSGKGESLRQQATSLSTDSVYFTQSGRHDQALQAGALAVMYCRQIANRAPEFANKTLAFTLHNCADSLTILGDHEFALVNLSEAAEIYRKLSSDQPDQYLNDFGRTLNDLCQSYFFMELDDDAITAAEEALEVYDKLSSLNPLLYSTYAAKSHLNIGTAHLRRSNIDRAMSEAKLADSLLAQHRKDHDIEHIVCSGEVKLLAASCEFELGKLAEALEEAEQAVALLSNVQGHKYAVIATLANAHTTVGIIAAQLDEFGKAISSLNHALTLQKELLDSGIQSIKPFIERLSRDIVTLEAMMPVGDASP